MKKSYWLGWFFLILALVNILWWIFIEVGTLGNQFVTALFLLGWYKLTVGRK